MHAAEPAGGDEHVLVAVAGDVGEREAVTVAELDLKERRVRRDRLGADLDLARGDGARPGLRELELDRQIGEAVRGERHLTAWSDREVEERAVVRVAADRRRGRVLRADHQPPRHQPDPAGDGQPGRLEVEAAGVAGLVARPDVDAGGGEVGGRPEQVEAGVAVIGPEPDLVDHVAERATTVVAEEDRLELVVGGEDVEASVPVGIGDADVEQPLRQEVRRRAGLEARLRGAGRSGGERGCRERGDADPQPPPHARSVIALFARSATRAHDPMGTDHLECRARGPDRRRIDRLRLRPHPVRGARADARRRRHPLRPRGVVLRRGPRRRAGRRRLRRRRVRDPPQPRRRHGRHRARPGRQDVLLGRPLRARRQHPPHAPDRPQRLRALRAQALAGLPGRRRPVPGQHPARPAARGARAVHRRALRGDGLDEPVDRHCPRLPGARDRSRRPRADERRRAADADRGAEPRRRRPPDHGARADDRGRQARRVRRRPLHRRRHLRDAGPADRRGSRPDRRRRLLRRRLPRLPRRPRRSLPEQRRAPSGDGPRLRPRLLQRRGLRDRARPPARARGHRHPRERLQEPDALLSRGARCWDTRPELRDNDRGETSGRHSQHHRQPDREDLRGRHQRRDDPRPRPAPDQGQRG